MKVRDKQTGKENPIGFDENRFFGHFEIIKS